MSELLEGVRKEYERWCTLLGKEDPYKGERTVGLHDVLWAHFLLVDYFSRRGEGLGGVGPRDPNLLHSALHRQFTSYGHIQKWREDLDRCATLFFGLILDHAFHDCNKRTAFLVLLHHLQVVGRCPSVRQREFERLALATAEHKLHHYTAFERFRDKDDAEVRFISDFLRRSTRHIDKRYYVITYNDLNTILSHFGFALENPHRNRIDIVKVEEKKPWFGGSAKPVRTRLAQIGFPGWKTQVGQGGIRTVRKCTGLTPENGCDSQVFFHGVDPLSSLINEFSGPLRRLADK